MISMKIKYLFRLLYYRMKPRISIKGRIFIQNNVRIVIEKNGRLIVGKNVVIKNNTIIYVKENALLEIGNETSIGHHNEISVGGKIIIGSDNIFAPYVYVTDSNHRYSNILTPIRKQGMIILETKVGSNNWIARNVNILAGSSIPDGCVIAAGAIITTKFTNDNVIIGGIPAREIKKRS